MELSCCRAAISFSRKEGRGGKVEKGTEGRRDGGMEGRRVEGSDSSEGRKTGQRDSGRNELRAPKKGRTDRRMTEGRRDGGMEGWRDGGTVGRWGITSPYPV